MADASAMMPLVVSGLAKSLLYVGVLIALGRALTALIVSPAPGGATTVVRVLMGSAAIALLLAPVLLLQQQLVALELPFADASTVIAETAWGRGWQGVGITAALTAAVLAAHLLHRPSRTVRARGLTIALAVFAMALSIAMGALGHPAADANWPVTARVVDAVHVLAMGGWIGGLLVTWAAVRDGPSAWAMAAWRAFSRAATVLAPLTLFSGVAGSALRLTEAMWPAALGTEYVRLLIVKSVLVLLVLAYGARQRQRVHRAQRPPSSAVVQEAALAMGVLLVTAILTGTEPPSAP